MPKTFVQQTIPVTDNIDEAVEMIPQENTLEQIPEGGVDASQVGLQAFEVY